MIVNIVFQGAASKTEVSEPGCYIKNAALVGLAPPVFI